MNYKGIEDATDEEDIPEQFQLVPKDKQKGGALELPSMKDVVTRKKFAQQQSSTGPKDEPSPEDSPKKIKRSNIQTFNKVGATSVFLFSSSALLLSLFLHLLR